MKALLVAGPAPGQGRTFTLQEGENVLGREPGMAVSLQSPGVSRQHARISHEGGAWWLEDLKSTNGTFLNGDPVVKERLRHLDVIGLGKQAELLFLLREMDASLPPIETKLGVVACTLTGADGIAHDVPAGEVRLGRSPAANIIVNADAVSKFHARIQRTADQVVLEDLDSINGTLVNGERVKRRPLLDGDVISLAGVEQLAVRIEMGEITTRSGRYRASALPVLSTTEVAAADDQAFSADWKTRFEWDTDELKQLSAIRKSVEDRDKAAKATARRPADPKPTAKAAEGSGATVRQDVVPKAKPAPKAAPPEPAQKPAGAEKPAPAAKAASAEPAEKPAPASRPPAPASMPPAPRPTEKPAPAARPVPAAPGPIKEVRLVWADQIYTVDSVGSKDIGRAQDAPLRVNHPTVSRRHARLVVEASAAFVEDLGGTNGTMLNGKVITGRKELQDGDMIGVGDVQLKVAIQRG